jgi:hypothetical protein
MRAQGRPRALDTPPALFRLQPQSIKAGAYSLKLAHSIREHFENGKSLAGKTLLGDRYAPPRPYLFLDCSYRILLKSGSGPVRDYAVLYRLNNIDAARDSLAHDR